METKKNTPILDVRFFGATLNGFEAVRDEIFFSEFDHSGGTKKENLIQIRTYGGFLYYTLVRYGLKTSFGHNGRTGSLFGMSLVCSNLFKETDFIRTELYKAFNRMSQKEARLIAEQDGQIAFTVPNLKNTNLTDYEQHYLSYFNHSLAEATVLESSKELPEISSKRYSIHSDSNPEAILEFIREYGFIELSDSQDSELVKENKEERTQRKAKKTILNILESPKKLQDKLFTLFKNSITEIDAYVKSLSNIKNLTENQVFHKLDNLTIEIKDKVEKQKNEFLESLTLPKIDELNTWQNQIILSKEILKKLNNYKQNISEWEKNIESELIKLERNSVNSIDEWKEKVKKLFQEEVNRRTNQIQDLKNEISEIQKVFPDLSVDFEKGTLEKSQKKKGSSIFPGWNNSNPSSKEPKSKQGKKKWSWFIMLPLVVISITTLILISTFIFLKRDYNILKVDNNSINYNSSIKPNKEIFTSNLENDINNLNNIKEDSLSAELLIPSASNPNVRILNIPVFINWAKKNKDSFSLFDTLLLHIIDALYVKSSNFKQEEEKSIKEFLTKNPTNKTRIDSLLRIRKGKISYDDPGLSFALENLWVIDTNEHASW